MITALLLSAGVVLAMPQAAPVDLGRLVLAIEHKENGKWESPGGRACWTRAAWSEESRWSFAKASLKEFSRPAMRQRLQRFTDLFRREGIEPTVWRLASAWHFGYEGSKRHPRIEKDFGTLTEGIYEANP